MTPSENVHTVVGIGEVLWDLYREERYLGGAPANFAVHSRQLGLNGVIASRIGQDGMGFELQRTLEARGLTTEYLQSDREHGTGTVMIQLDIRGNARYRCSRDVAFDYLEFDEGFAELAGMTDAVMFGSLGQRNAKSRETIQQFLRLTRGVRLFDLNARGLGPGMMDIIKSSLQVTDILKVNEDEVQLLLKAFRREGEQVRTFARSLMDEFPLKMLVVTKGAAGSVMIDRRRVTRMESPEVEMVDSTGAGDAFCAGLIYKHLQGATPRQTLEFANRMGGFVCAHQGATPELSESAVLAFAS